MAWGAAYYAWLRHSGGKRIGGGIARSYYVAIDAAQEKPQGSELTVVCVVPQHLEEGQEINLEKPELELSLGQPVLFPLYTSTVRGDDKAGDVLTLAREQLLQLPPLTTVLRGGKRSGTRQVPVTLAARSTAIGTLELFCVAQDGGNRWRLEFNVRDLVKDPTPRSEGDGESGPNEAVTEVWLESQVQDAARLLRATFTAGGSDPKPEPRELTKELETALDATRHQWPTGLCRRLWEFLAEVAEGRRLSPQHQTRWFNLVGWCLRPGFGDPLDKFRIEQLWKLLAAPPRVEPTKGVQVVAPRVLEGGADYWILWRRVAGGLSATLQQALYERMRPAILPVKNKTIIKPNPNELAEMWRAAASFERLDVKHKQSLGESLLKQIKRSPVPTYAFWALTRLGARSLLYGPLNAVLHPQVAESWLDTILSFVPSNQSERLAWAFCLAQLARRTGQRALDIGDSHRDKVLQTLEAQQSVPEHWIEMVKEVTELESEEQGQMLGDTLPIGLRLIGESRD